MDQSGKTQGLMGEQWNRHRVTHTHTVRTVEWTLSYSYSHRENSGRVTQTQSQGEQWRRKPSDTYTHTGLTLAELHINTHGRAVAELQGPRRATVL